MSNEATLKSQEPRMIPEIKPDPATATTIESTTTRLIINSNNPLAGTSKDAQILHANKSDLGNTQNILNKLTMNVIDNYSTSGEPKLDAVIIRNLTYEIGRGRAKKAILNRINLTVPEGSIYGLLGPSGCGKTTMLRCVVGRLKPARRAGSVLVFGLVPGDKRGQVPGRDIGYMPQEISIYEDFTIEETLIYFAKINRMVDSQISARIDFLLKFLDLPTKTRPVVNLSGGQKRRVSLAAALVHSPPLLILDEPTVGVDPLLRKGIWTHLVTLTQTERISVIITTHYIEEARQANVVGLMRNGRILAENSPQNLMQTYGQTNLEDVFLHLCVTDSANRASLRVKTTNNTNSIVVRRRHQRQQQNDPDHQSGHSNASENQIQTSDNIASTSKQDSKLPFDSATTAHIRIHTATNKIEFANCYTNETLDFSSDNDDDLGENKAQIAADAAEEHRFASDLLSVDKQFKSNDPVLTNKLATSGLVTTRTRFDTLDYLTNQALGWSARRNNELNMIQFRLNNRAFVDGTLQFNNGNNNGNNSQLNSEKSIHRNGDALRKDHQMQKLQVRNHWLEWWRTLLAVTWKNYVRLRRNPPVLIFQFMLPAIQVILFCLCIGGEPFDVPVAIVNEESQPRSSLQFLNGLDKRVIRQIKYDNLTSAVEAVKKGYVWGAVHIPEKYSQNLQTRLIMGEEVTNETLSNGTIRVYPDLTNLHLALALETTFRETFFNFARNSLEDMGYDKSLADLPIQLGQPIYGTLKKDSYLEFMAPGVVISISYVMATGLTALAFILERRDGLLERSLVSGVGTSQILLAHAINQVVVMIIQIFLVLGCTFFVFEIPSRGPFFWVVLLILLQGCTGMAFGLLVSAVCKEENTAVMMVVGTFYTNLILAGIIWPIEAMPHWLRPVSYAQPQTLATETLRHILSRGWGISEPLVLLGFAVTIGWLFVFLIAAGLIFKYAR